MQTLPLIGGSYSARSVIANGQRCINLFPEVNRADSPTRVTHYQRPGLVPLVSPTVAAVGRCLYQASNGDAYAIMGSKLYFVSSAWTLYQLGTLTAGLTNPCSMVDNGIQLLVVEGVPYAGNATGYVRFATNPAAGNTVTFNGVVFTFIAGATSGTDVHIGGTVGITIGQELLGALQASTNPLLTGASYADSAGPAGAVDMNATSHTAGALGTLYTLAASVATRSGPKLALGGTPVPGKGWTVDLGDTTGATFTLINDAAWTGADRVDYIDSFIVWNQPGTNLFGSTLSNDILPLDATYVAGKTNWPDQLQSIIVNREQIFLPGTLKSELWYDAGNTAFPFARLPGTSAEHGLLAKYSICSADLNVYWLSRDLQGQGIVLRLRGNEVKRISNYALEYQIRLMAAAGSITDAVAYTYQVDGHLFYVLSFPTGNQTWVWDESVVDPELGWSQRCWTGLDGGLNRDRGVLGASLYGKNVVLDWENGTLYEQSMTTYTDTVLAREYPITYLRTFPHLMAGTDPKTGQPVLANGQMVQHSRFALDAECGNAGAGVSPSFVLRWSDDRGVTWKTAPLIPAGRQGEFGTRPDSVGLGQAMDRVYEVSWTFAGQVALNGAWVEGMVSNR